MNAPARFLFDVDFANGGDGKRAMAIAEHLAKIAAAEEAAYRKGFAAAEKEAQLDNERRTAAAFEKIATALDALIGGLAAVEARIEAEAIEVAVAVAQKLAPALVAREPMEEIAALATTCFRQLVAAPHIVVRVNDTQHDSAREKLEEMARARGFEGRLVVLGEPEIAPGDCRIEWADGGVNRDSAATRLAIDDAVSRYVTGRAAVTQIPEVAWRADQ
jgi:flagellar assembly protein FliH